jgi:hypothetical protein
MHLRPQVIRQDRGFLQGADGSHRRQQGPRRAHIIVNTSLLKSFKVWPLVSSCYLFSLSERKHFINHHLDITAIHLSTDASAVGS